MYKNSEQAPGACCGIVYDSDHYTKTSEALLIKSFPLTFAAGAEVWGSWARDRIDLWPPCVELCGSMGLFRRGRSQGRKGGCGRSAWLAEQACTSAHFTRRTKRANCLLLTARPLQASDVLGAAGIIELRMRGIRRIL